MDATPSENGSKAAGPKQSDDESTTMGSQQSKDASTSDELEDVFGVWYRHSGEEELEWIQHECLTYKQKTEAEIKREIGDHHVTDIAVQGKLPAFKEIGSHITTLICRALSSTTQFERLNKLPKLSALTCYSCNFSSGLPKGITQLTGLKELRLPNCKLTDLPEELTSLNQLEMMDLDMNGFIQGIPPVICAMSSLKMLHLSFCKLDDLPIEFAQLQELHTLFLTHNFFTELPPAVYKLRKLEVLRLDDNAELEYIEEDIMQMPEIDLLTCYGCNSLIFPPFEVCKQGIPGLKKYFKFLKKAGKVGSSPGPSNAIGGFLPCETFPSASTEQQKVQETSPSTALPTLQSSTLPETQTLPTPGGNRMKQVSTTPVTSSTAVPSMSSAHSTDDDSELSDSIDYLDENRKELDYISLRLEPVSKQHIKELFNSPKVYKMSAPIRGRALIINNDDFGSKMSPRRGSEWDVKNIKNVFRHLSFDFEKVHMDLSSQDMLNVIEQETKHPDHFHFGMFVLVIMTHGKEGHIFGTDGEAVNLSKVYDLISPYEFKAMAGKPKWVILQACSGVRSDVEDGYTSDSGGAAASANIQSPSPPSRYASDAPESSDHLATDDLFITKASFYSYISIRHVLNGSWLIRALVEALYKHSCHRDIETLFKDQVMKKVRAKSLSKRDSSLGAVSGQQPTMESFPTKGRKLYLFPGFNAL